VNNATPDGSYLLRVTTFDTCGHSASNQISVVLDNTAPIGTISSPVQCSKRAGTIPIYGTAFDGNLAAWVLQYSDLNSHGWTDIASGSSAVFNGLLANWNTTGLPACAYALRLVVTDQSKVNMDCSGSSGANQTIYMLTLDLVSDQLAQDTDADGMPDAWEVAHGFNASDPSDAAQDADNDGKTNLEEYLAGTDPRDAGSVFRITSISLQGNDASVSWTAVGGHNYLLEAAPNLTSGLFSSISPLISMPTGAMTHFVHTNGGTAPERLYRLRLVR
jgi:hypothetical protein